jgi:hypothetical protein
MSRPQTFGSVSARAKFVHRLLPMKFKRQMIVRSVMAIMSCLVVGGLVWGQVASSGSQSLLDTVLQEQRALSQESTALFNQGTVTSANIGAWQAQHAAEIQVLQQNAQALGATSELQPLPYITEANVPANASDQLADFLVGQANLANDFAHIHNQQVQSLATSTGANAIPNAAQMGQITQAINNEATVFQQQDANQIQVQRQRAQAMANTGNQSALPTPPPLVIPNSASADLRAVMILHDQIERQQIQILNANLASDPSVRTAAVAQWQQQNAAVFIQHLSQTSTNH